MALTFTSKQGPTVSVTGGGTDDNRPDVSAYGSAADWAASGHVLGLGEMGLDTTTGQLRTGNGVQSFDRLLPQATALDSLKEWAVDAAHRAGGNMPQLVYTFDGYTGTMRWPDGSTGAYTSVATNPSGHVTGFQFTSTGGPLGNRTVIVNIPRDAYGWPTAPATVTVT